jgi:argininosuccinate lyase
MWCSPAFGFVRLSDAFTTGSSIMPQKRNPDAAELARAKTGRIVGSLVGLLTVMKGLPLAYAKDTQEDKEGVFDAAESLALCLAATAAMLRDMKPNLNRMAEAAGAGFSTATDLADWLVRELKMPFRDAHHVTGRLVAQAEAMGVDLAGLTLREMQTVEPRITDGVFGVLTPAASAASRTSYGGTAPANVAVMVQYWQEKLA